jgi:5'-methylthioadenosine phosphorylase
VVAIIHKNVATARSIIRAAVRDLAMGRSCKCGEALQYAIMTQKDLIPEATRQKLDIIMGKYL